uniref:NADH-ubiquinone oxidoreductase chain 6 n=1 Tax=Scolytinae sp. BMNH 1040341 TaxID=1903792 RepID=A0A343A677_9CUCU|nr:NADH dehydrogenase subunit 6 [Scolytinae sp. BMNH 1040341]
MSYLLLLNCILSLMLMLFKNPLSKGYMLLLLTITTSLSSSLMHLDSWFGYILFLVMIGGMLVAFIYMTSIASNEKFDFPQTKTLLFMSGMIALSMGLFMYLPSPFLNNQLMMFSSQEILLPKNSLFLTKIFSSPLSQLPIALMSYLFLTLIMVVKMTDFAKGPIRQK